MFKVILDFLLVRLISIKVKNKKSLSLPIYNLKLGSFAEEGFYENNIYTVGQALYTYYFDNEVKGIGVKSWDRFFTAIKAEGVK
jgi:hypothetical protein